MSDHGLFSSCGCQQRAAAGQICLTFFRDAQGFERLDDGSHAGFIRSRPSPL